MSVIREIYLTLYLLGQRYANHRGQDGFFNSLAGAFLLYSVVIWFEIGTGKRINEFWPAVIFFFLIDGLNFRYLNETGAAAAFEKEFDQFPRRKRRILIASAISAFAAIFTILVITGLFYRRILVGV